MTLKMLTFFSLLHLLVIFPFSLKMIDFSLLSSKNMIFGDFLFSVALVLYEHSTRLDIVYATARREGLLGQ